MDLRCTSKLHAVLVTPSIDEGVIEFRCTSRWCGGVNGTVVLHRFSTSSGKLLGTKRYQPAPRGR